jgi:hypothetical protein
MDYVGHFEREAAAFEAAARLGENDSQVDGQDDGQGDGTPGIQISGTASDLALFLWQRPVTDRLDVRGDSSLLERYFVLVPPV